MNATYIFLLGKIKLSRTIFKQCYVVRTFTQCHLELIENWNVIMHLQFILIPIALTWSRQGPCIAQIQVSLHTTYTSVGSLGLSTQQRGDHRVLYLYCPYTYHMYCDCPTRSMATSYLSWPKILLPFLFHSQYYIVYWAQNHQFKTCKTKRKPCL